MPDFSQGPSAGLNYAAIQSSMMAGVGVTNKGLCGGLLRDYDATQQFNLQNLSFLSRNMPGFCGIFGSGGKWGGARAGQPGIIEKLVANASDGLKQINSAGNQVLAQGAAMKDSEIAQQAAQIGQQMAQQSGVQYAALDTSGPTFNSGGSFASRIRTFAGSSAALNV